MVCARSDDPERPRPRHRYRELGVAHTGGLTSRVTLAFGHRAGRFASAAAIVERLLLGALASVVIGHYTAGVAVTAIAERRFTGYVTSEDLATLFAAAAIGFLWIRTRIGREVGRDATERAVWVGIGILTLTIVWGVLTVAFGGPMPSTAPSSAGVPITLTGWPLIDGALIYVLGIALTLPVIGSGDVLARAAHDLPPPRVQALRQTAVLVTSFAFVVTVLGTFLFIRLVSAGELALWVNAPLADLAQHVGGPGWLRDLLALALAFSTVLVLLPAVYGAMTDMERMLHLSSADGALPAGLASLHTRFGTPARAIDVTTAATILVIVMSGGRFAWLARAYAVGIAATLLLTIATLVRLRRIRQAAQPFRTPGTPLIRGRELPLGLLMPGVIAGGSVLAMLAIGDAPSVVSAALIGAMGLWFVVVGHQATPASIVDERDTFDLFSAAELSLDQIEARPGNVLVPVRNPHALGHVVAALQAAGDRDVVVMTVRLIGIDDAGVEPASESIPTPYERRLLRGRARELDRA
jgi:amino acid transporter